MLRFTTINYDGGRRTYQDVPVVVEKITEERHWRNLWLRKTQRILFKIETSVIFQDGEDEIKFPKNIVIHDFDGDFSETKIGDVLISKIGYADQSQQYYHRVNSFSVSILKQEEMIQLVQ